MDPMGTGPLTLSAQANTANLSGQFQEGTQALDKASAPSNAAEGFSQALATLPDALLHSARDAGQNVSLWVDKVQEALDLQKIEIQLKADTLLQAASEEKDKSKRLILLQIAYEQLLSAPGDEAKELAPQIKQLLIEANDRAGLVLFQTTQLLQSGKFEEAWNLINQTVLRDPDLSQEPVLLEMRDKLEKVRAEIPRMEKRTKALQILQDFGEVAATQNLIAEVSRAEGNIPKRNAACNFYLSLRVISAAQDLIRSGKALTLAEAIAYMKAHRHVHVPALQESGKADLNNPVGWAEGWILERSTDYGRLSDEIDRNPFIHPLMTHLQRIEAADTQEEKNQSILEFGKWNREIKNYISARHILGTLAYHQRNSPEGIEAYNIVRDSEGSDNIYIGVSDETWDFVQDVLTVDLPMTILSGGVAGAGRALFVRGLMAMGSRLTGTAGRFLLNKGFQIAAGLFMESALFEGMTLGKEALQGRLDPHDLSAEGFLSRVAKGMVMFGCLNFAKHVVLRYQMPRLSFPAEFAAFSAAPTFQACLGLMKPEERADWERKSLGAQALVNFKELIALKIGHHVFQVPGLQEANRALQEKYLRLQNQIAQLQGNPAILQGALTKLVNGFDPYLDPGSQGFRAKLALGKGLLEALAHKKIGAAHLITLEATLKKQKLSKFDRWSLNAILKDCGFHLVEAKEGVRLERKKGSLPFRQVAAQHAKGLAREILLNPVATEAFLISGVAILGNLFTALQSAQYAVFFPFVKARVHLDDATAQKLEALPEEVRQEHLQSGDPNPIQFGLNHLLWMAGLIRRDAPFVGLQALIDSGKILFGRFQEDPKNQAKVELKLNQIAAQAEGKIQALMPEIESWWQPFWEKAIADPQSSIDALAFVLQRIERENPEWAMGALTELEASDFDRAFAIRERMEEGEVVLGEESAPFREDLDAFASLLESGHLPEINAKLAELFQAALQHPSLEEALEQAESLHHLLSQAVAVWEKPLRDSAPSSPSSEKAAADLYPSDSIAGNRVLHDFILIAKQVFKDQLINQSKMHEVSFTIDGALDEGALEIFVRKSLGFGPEVEAYEKQLLESVETLKQSDPASIAPTRERLKKIMEGNWEAGFPLPKGEAQIAEAGYRNEFVYRSLDELLNNQANASQKLKILAHLLRKAKTEGNIPELPAPSAALLPFRDALQNAAGRNAEALALPMGNYGEGPAMAYAYCAYVMQFTGNIEKAMEYFEASYTALTGERATTEEHARRRKIWNEIIAPMGRGEISFENFDAAPLRNEMNSTSISEILEAHKRVPKALAFVVSEMLAKAMHRSGPGFIPVEFVTKFPANGIVTLGRDPANVFEVDYPGISRNHLRLKISNGRLEAEDLGSTNGSLLTRKGDIPADLSIGGSHRLQKGDRIVVGKTYSINNAIDVVDPDKEIYLINTPGEGQDVLVTQDAVQIPLDPSHPIDLGSSSNESVVLKNPGVISNHLKIYIGVDNQIRILPQAPIFRIRQDGTRSSLMASATNPPSFVFAKGSAVGIGGNGFEFIVRNEVGKVDESDPIFLIPEGKDKWTLKNKSAIDLAAAKASNLELAQDIKLLPLPDQSDALENLIHSKTAYIFPENLTVMMPPTALRFYVKPANFPEAPFHTYLKIKIDQGKLQVSRQVDTGETMLFPPDHISFTNFHNQQVSYADSNFQHALSFGEKMLVSSSKGQMLIECRAKKMDPSDPIVMIPQEGNRWIFVNRSELSAMSKAAREDATSTLVGGPAALTSPFSLGEAPARNYENLPARDIHTIPEQYRHLIPKPSKKTLFPRFQRMLDEVAYLLTAPDRIAVRFFGPPGTAKTTIPEMIAGKMGIPLLRMPFSRRTDAGDLQGLWKMEKVGGKLVPVFEEGAPTVSMEHGFHLVWDEPDLARPGVLAALNNISAPGKEVWVRGRDGSLRKISVHADFRVYATENGVGQIGREEHGPDFLRRFVSYHVGTWSVEEITQVLSDLYEGSNGSRRWPHALTESMALFHHQMEQLCKGFTDPNTRASIPPLGSGIGQSVELTPRSALRLARRLAASGPVTAESMARAIRAEYILPFADPNDRETAWIQANAVFGPALEKMGIPRGSLSEAAIPKPSLESISEKYLGGKAIPRSAFVWTQQALNVVDEILWNRSLGIDVMLLGKAGQGKTEIPEQISKLLGLEFYQETISSQTDPEDLVGAYGRSGEDYDFVPGKVALGVKNGGVIHLDEYLLGETGKLEGIMNPLMDDERALIITNPYQIIDRHPDTFILLSSNPPFGEYADRNEQSGAAMSRVAVIYLEGDFAMSPADRKNIFQSKLGAPAEVPGKKKALSEDGASTTPILRNMATPQGQPGKAQLLHPIIHPEIAGKFGIPEKIWQDPRSQEIFEEAADGSLIPASLDTRKGLEKLSAYLTRRTQVEMGPMTGRAFKINYNLRGGQYSDLSGKEIYLNLIGLLEYPLMGALAVGKHEWSHLVIDRPSEKYDAHEPGRLLANLIGDPRMNEFFASLRGDFRDQLMAMSGVVYPKEYDLQRQEHFKSLLPHEQFAYAITHFWCHREIMPWIDNPKVREALEQALPLAEPAFTLFPKSYGEADVDAAADAFYKIVDQVWPIYEGLFPESMKELMKRLEAGESPEDLKDPFLLPEADPEAEPAPEATEPASEDPAAQEARKILEEIAKEIFDQRAEKIADQFEPQDPEQFKARKAFIAKAKEDAKKGAGPEILGPSGLGSDPSPSLEEADKAAIQQAQREAHQAILEQNLFLSMVPPSAVEAARKLKRLMPPVEPKYWEGHFTRGRRMDPREAMQDELRPVPSGKIFLRKLTPGDHDAQIMILSDISSSMDAAKENNLRASATAIYLSEALKIEYGEILFAKGVQVIKELGRALGSYTKKNGLLNDKKAKIEGRQYSNDGTNLREPIALAIEALKDRRGHSKYILLITDGAEGVTSYPKNLQQLQAEAEKEGIHLMVLAVGPVAQHFVPKTFKNYRFANADGSDMPERIIELFSAAQQRRNE